MSGKPNPIRVLVVDDQPLQRMGTILFLQGQADMEPIGEAADGGEAVRLSEELRPDVVLMDVRMPGLDGIAATRMIVGRSPAGGAAPRVLLLTTFDLDEYVLAGLAAGASGFITKDAEPGDLLSAIRAVAGGDTVLAPRATRRLLERLAASQDQPTGDRGREEAAVVAQLTPREQEILVAIGEGLTNAEIAAQLFLAESTVKSHVGRIFAKIGARDRVQAVILAFRAGLVRV